MQKIYILGLITKVMISMNCINNVLLPFTFLWLVCKYYFEEQHRCGTREDKEIRCYGFAVGGGGGGRLACMM